MQQHKIDWLNMPGYKGETWNPIIGCSRISEGCRNCYAEKMAGRLAHIPGQEYHNVVKPNLDPQKSGYFERKWNGQTHLVASALEKPLHWKKPRMIFVCSMSDLFHEDTPFEWIDRVFEIMATTPHHLYLLLTKRPERALEFFKWFGNKIKIAGFDSIPTQSVNPLDYYSPLPNVWVGVTAEDQEQVNKRIPVLLQIPVVIRYVSYEPALGDVDFTQICLQPKRECVTHNVLNGIPYDWDYEQWFPENQINEKIDWVICGGESGHKARPMHPDWVRSVRDQCKEANVPFFFKQWGEWGVDSEVRFNGPFLYPVLERIRPKEYRAMTPDGYSEKYHDFTDASPEAFKEQKIDKETPNAWWMAKVGKHQSGSRLDGKYHKEFPQL